MMLHVCADVFSKYLFNAPFTSTLQVVSGYYMVLISFFPLALVGREGGHIMVELFTRRLSRRATLRLDGAVGFVTLAYVLLLTWKTTEEALRRTAEGELWEIATGYLAIWPSRWFAPIGFGLLAIYVLLRIFRDLRAHRGD